MFILISAGVSMRSSDLSSRLKSDTEELGRELMEHVENLRSTLDHMSKRLNTPSDSDA